MRRPLLLSIALLLTLAPAARAADPVIAPGISVAGLDVSGLTMPVAAQKIAGAYQGKMESPISTHVPGHRFLLRGNEIDLKFDAAKSARRAYNAGIAPHIGLVDVPLYITFSNAKVTAYAEKVTREVSKPARDARVNITLRRIERVKSRDGRTLDTKALAAQAAATLGDPASERKLNPAYKPVKPKITTAGLAKAYGTIITIDRHNFTLRLFKGLKLSKTYRVAVGQPGYPTPTGRFSISNKAVNPAWTAPNSPWAGAYANETVAGGSAENPLKARWMGIVNGVGIHGTGIPGSIGSAASHGCIRMTVPDVIDLYPRVPVGTPVLIGN
jgi:lipoprotein-anchoring transpeptidase ErfK/SrfK